MAEDGWDASQQAVALGAALRRAREARGLGLRELAAALGVSSATVNAAEKGSDVRHSTLLRYAEVLPALTPDRLLVDGPPAPPSASMATWRSLRDVFGFSIGRLRFEITLDEAGERLSCVEASEVQARGGLRSARSRSRLMQLLLLGSPEARLVMEGGRVPATGKNVVIEDGCFRHRFDFDGKAMSYRRDQLRPESGYVQAPTKIALSAPFAEGISLSVERPVKRLELCLRTPAGRRGDSPRAACWTDLQAVTAEQADYSSLLHPRGLDLLEERDSVELRVAHPVLGLYYGFGWDETPTPTSDPVPRVGRSRSLELTLREAREQSGLSQRKFAERLQVSPATIARAEEGRELQRSTLQAYLRCAGLRPEELLRPRSCSTATRDEVWEHQRALLGIESEVERKSLVVDPNGDARAVYETIGLRRLRPAPEDLRIRYGSAPSAEKDWPTELQGVEDAIARKVRGRGLKTRVVARHQGRVIHEIVVPSESAGEGVAFSRRMFTPRIFDPSLRLNGEDEAEIERGEMDGAAITPFHAVQELSLRITFPPAYWPSRFWFSVHPRMMLAGPSPACSLTERFHPDGLATQVDSRTRTVSLTASRPLIGFMYDIFWAPPREDRSDQGE